MSLLNVDQKERYPILVFSIEFVQCGNLPPKRRSGVTAEEEDQRSVAYRAQIRFLSVFQMSQFQRRDRIAELQSVGTAIGRDDTQGGFPLEGIRHRLDVDSIPLVQQRR